MREDELRPAWVLHARPYRETSLLLELLVLGRGRVGAVARGVREGRRTGRRALLQPLQPLEVALAGRGELPTLARAEATSAPLRLRGDALLAALYVNELCQRLLPREEPADALFLSYAACLGGLAEGHPVAQCLRVFELELLHGIGYGLALDRDADGRPIRAEACYWAQASGRFEPVAPGAGPALSGRTLMALAARETIAEAEHGALRRLLRERLQQALGPRRLRCWGLLDELAGLAARGGPQASVEGSSRAEQAASKR